MDIRTLITRNLIHYAVGLGVAGAAILGMEQSAAAVPECNCTVVNYPSPGNYTPGLRVDGDCYLEPCGS